MITTSLGVLCVEGTTSAAIAFRVEAVDRIADTQAQWQLHSIDWHVISLRDVEA